MEHGYNTKRQRRRREIEGNVIPPCHHKSFVGGLAIETVYLA